MLGQCQTAFLRHLDSIQQLSCRLATYMIYSILQILIAYFGSFAFACIYPPDATQLDKQAASVIVQKSKMSNRYCLRLRIEDRTPTATPPVETAWGSSLNIWRDGDKFRVDHFDAQYTPKRTEEVAGNRRITCENCERPGFGIITAVLPGSPPILNQVSFHRLGSFNFDLYCTHFDWRFLGLNNSRLCHYPQLHVAVSFPSFFRTAGLVMRTDSRNGVPCSVAEVKAAINDRAVWLSARDGDNPVYFEEVIRVGTVPEVRSTQIAWQQTAGGHWYPKTIKHNTVVSFNNGKHATEEVITIAHADFDSPIDPAVFTLAGLELNEYQPIGFPGVKYEDQPVWRQGKADETYTVRDRMKDSAKNSGANSRTSEVEPLGKAPYPSGSSTTLVIGIVAACLAIATAVLAIVIRLRRSRP